MLDLHRPDHPLRSEALIAHLKVSLADEHRLLSAEPLERFLYERYIDDTDAWKRHVYYGLKPLIPRAAQIWLRQLYASRQLKRLFPSWPIETKVTDLIARAIESVDPEEHEAPLFGIAPWPSGFRFAFCVTHDVEWDTGLRRAPALLDVERNVGVASSWNLVPERYPIDWTIVEQLRQAGSEIGIHGLKHDGRLFRSKRLFLGRLKQIERYANDWGAVGFRSPSCLRNAEWMKAMHFEYDSSFPDTDPFEPQPGGCCSVWPYFIGKMVELPLTMPQDHTIYEILGHHDLSIWDQKADWISAVGGLVLINVHPDYIDSNQRLRQYEDFLRRMMDRQGVWHALPKDVARWWRDRNDSLLTTDGTRHVISGPGANRATARQLTAG